MAKVREVRARLLALGGVDEPAYAAIPMQGSGTFGVEAMLGSLIPASGRLLVPANGAYGRRIVQLARRLGIETVQLDSPEARPVDAATVEAALRAHPTITHVAVVHCETSTGLLNPVGEIGAIARALNRRLLVDAMSSFGAVPLSLEALGIDALVSSANKCIEGVPGFSFALVRRPLLEACEGVARSVSLDLLDQVRALDRTGQFRFTPPTHALVAFHQALAELEQEGGIEGRRARYRANRAALLGATRVLGLREYLPDGVQSHLITAFLCPRDPRFDFEVFYTRLAERGLVIYPGKVSQADCFRIGTIGRLHPPDFVALGAAIRDVLSEMGIALPLGEEPS